MNFKTKLLQLLTHTQLSECFSVISINYYCQNYCGTSRLHATIIPLQYVYVFALNASKEFCTRGMWNITMPKTFATYFVNIANEPRTAEILHGTFCSAGFVAEMGPKMSSTPSRKKNENAMHSLSFAGVVI